MEFNPNKTPVEIIKESVFGGTYFRDIYSGVNRKQYKNSWKEFDDLKNVEQEYYSSHYYDVELNKYKVKTRTALRFWENKSWINELDPHGWFQWYFRYVLGRRSSDDFIQINRCKKAASRFKGELVKMIKYSGSEFDDYSISTKIKQISLHWGYELKKDLL